MLTLYHAPLTRSTRVRWLLEELDVPHTIHAIDFFSDERSKPEFRALSPQGRLPVIQDDDFVLFESGAIVEYLLDEYGNGQFQPGSSAKERAPMLQWMHWGEATLLPPMDKILEHGIIRPPEKRIAEVADEGRAQTAECLEALEAQLAKTKEKGPFILGELTGADFVTFYGIWFAEILGELENSPNIKAYFEAFMARPKFQAAMADSFEAVQVFADMIPKK